MQLGHSDRVYLRNLLVDRFGSIELEGLCFDVDVDHRSFQHRTIDEFARNLIEACQRRVILDRLVAEVWKRRPDDQLEALLMRVLVEQEQEIRQAHAIICANTQDSSSPLGPRAESDADQVVEQQWNRIEETWQAYKRVTEGTRLVRSIPGDVWEIVSRFDEREPAEPIGRGMTTGLASASSEMPFRFYALPWLSWEGRKALESALGEAIRVGCYWLGVEFLMMSLSRRPETSLRKLLFGIGVDPHDYRGLVRGLVIRTTGKDWNAINPLALGQDHLVRVKPFEPTWVKAANLQASAALLVVTPRLSTVLLNAVQQAGEGHVGYQALSRAALRQGPSLAIQAIYDLAAERGQPPAAVQEQMVQWTGSAPRSSRAEGPARSEGRLYLEVLSGPLDGERIVLDQETWWGRITDSPLSFPWDRGLGAYEARFTRRDGGWWLDKCRDACPVYHSSRDQPARRVEQEVRLAQGDLLRAHHTWLWVVQTS